jgi:hypothetical protein
VLQLLHHQSSRQPNHYQAGDDYEEVDEAIPEEEVGNKGVCRGVVPKDIGKVGGVWKACCRVHFSLCWGGALCSGVQLWLICG